MQFQGCWREWNPLPGHTPPEGKLFELHSIDDDVYACGATIEEAWSRLLEVIKAKKEHEKGEPLRRLSK